MFTKIGFVFSVAWKYVAPVVEFLLMKIFKEVLKVIWEAIEIAAIHPEWSNIQKTEYVRQEVYKKLRALGINWKEFIINIIIELIYAQKKI